MVKVKERLIKSHMAARSVFRDGMQGAVCSEWSIPFASTATQQAARKTSAHAGFDKSSSSSALCSLASYQRIRSADVGNYDALYLDYSCQNAAHGGLNQRFLNLLSDKKINILTLLANEHRDFICSILVR